MDSKVKKIISNIESKFIPQNPNEWGHLGEDFEKASAEETLEYALTHVIDQSDIIFLTAFGPEGCVLMHMIAELIQGGKLAKHRVIKSIADLEDTSISSRLGIANLDTGYQFKETIELKGQLEAKYDLPIHMIQPQLTVAEQDTEYGKDLYKSDPDQCCYMRKLVPLAKLLENRCAWITSIRREQTEHRANAKAFEYDAKFKLGKINPLIHWTKSDVWKYIHENQIPYNPLLDQGYDSIGCEPCTSPGSDRKGRWAGQDKIECGLHIQDSEQEQGGEFVI